MARPKTPLISRAAALELALRIIDEEGLDALSIRRLATEMNVNGASLYHHFQNKDQILVGAAALALADVRTPKGSKQDWPVWLMDNTRKYRNALLAHPELIPVLIQRHPLRIGLREHDATAGLLIQQGVPEELVMPLLESLEQIALGSVLYQSAVEKDVEADSWKESFPHLYRAARASGLDAEDIFELMSEATIDSIMSVAGRRRARNRSAAKRTDEDNGARLTSSTKRRTVGSKPR
jgi:AcrR family transcriptional regulator